MSASTLSSQRRSDAWLGMRAAVRRMFVDEQRVVGQECRILQRKRCRQRGLAHAGLAEKRDGTARHGDDAGMKRGPSLATQRERDQLVDIQVLDRRIVVPGAG